MQQRLNFESIQLKNHLITIDFWIIEIALHISDLRLS